MRKFSLSFYAWLFIRLLPVCFALPVVNLAAAPSSEIVGQEVIIDADRFEVMGQSSAVLAQGNVQVKQGLVLVTGQQATYQQADQLVSLTGDVKLIYNNDITITGPQMQVLGKQRLIKADGGVQFAFRNAQGESDAIDFDIAARTLRLTGQPHARQGHDEIVGTTILVLLSENRIVAEGKTRIVLSPETVTGKKP